MWELPLNSACIDSRAKRAKIVVHAHTVDLNIFSVPITTGNNEPDPGNHLFKSGALDIIGFNYHDAWYDGVPENFPGKPFRLAPAPHVKSLIHHEYAHAVAQSKHFGSRRIM